MLLAPLIERELRSATHKNRGMKSRLRVALIGACIVVLFLCISAFSGSTTLGRSLQQLFFYVGLYLAIAPTQISVGLFSEERRNQTLELLYLTGMNSGELFVGKLLGGVLVASSELLALAPLLAVPFLIGGISLDLYLATVVCLPTLLLFCIAIGVLASVLFSDDGVAFAFTLALAAAFCLAVPIPHYLGKVLTGAKPFSSEWLCLSPAYAPFLVATNFSGSNPRAFWLATLITFGWTVLCLVVACFILSRNWRSEVRGTQQRGWRGLFHVWIQGSVPWRTFLRNKLLPENPFQWLVQQDRRPLLLGYGAIV